MRKLLVVCGPTAVGKTQLAFKLAKEFDGELISADSRQVYKGMDIGTGKDLPLKNKLRVQNKKQLLTITNYLVIPYLINQINLWLYDVVAPNEEFSVANYYELAWGVIENIWRREKLPILVGGTGFYIKAVVDGVDTLGVVPDKRLRKNLENKTVLELQTILKKINYRRFSLMNNSDKFNPRRLIRAIEIESQLVKKPVEKVESKVDILMIGLTAKKEVLAARIKKRVEKRLKEGIINEIKTLLEKGYSWELPAISALGYRQWKGFFEGKVDFNKTVDQWVRAEYQYAKRQLTWFKKEKRVIWYDIKRRGFEKEILTKVQFWYGQ